MKKTITWAFVCLMTCSATTIYSQCDRQRDSLALVALYNATNGSGWTTPWDLSTSMDNWYGINLNVDGCVTCIDLDGTPDCDPVSNGVGNNLTGSLPKDLGQLSELQTLVLAENNLIGAIPSELSALSNLVTLNLNSNAFSGNIPSSLSNLSNLDFLNLSQNVLSGCIPNEILSLCGISGFNLSNNPQLPWEGNTMPFCLMEDQTGAICNDGDAATSGEAINACCSCEGDPDCNSDSTAPDLSGLQTLDNVVVCPAAIQNEQDVLDVLFGGYYMFLENVVDNCTDSIFDYEVEVIDSDFPTACGDIGFVEWGISDQCGNPGTGAPSGGNLYIVEWTINSSGASPLEWILQPDDFLPSDIDISRCTNELIPCLWQNDNMDTWDWQVLKDIHWKGGCDVKVIYSHLPCAAAIAMVSDQIPPPALVDFESNNSVNTEVCVQLIDACNPISTLQYCFDVAVTCATCSSGQNLICTTCEEAEQNCKLCDPVELAQGYSSCTPPCTNPGCAAVFDGTQPPSLCNTSSEPNNMSWFAFVANSTSLDLTLEVGTCSNGMGVQAGIYDSCEWDNCVLFFTNGNNNCILGSSTESGTFIPGQTYYLWVDGCAGDECEYTVTIEDLEYFGLPDIDAITAFSECRSELLTANPGDPNNTGVQSGPNGSSICNVNNTVTVCPGEVLYISPLHQGNPTSSLDILQVACNEYPDNLDANFIWDIDWLGPMLHNPAKNGGGFLPPLETPTAPGVYNVCLNLIDFECDVKLGPACLEIFVAPKANETFTYDVCVEELDGTYDPRGWNPDDAGQDPNGDGIGWLGDYVTLAEVDGWPVTPMGYNCLEFVHFDPECNCEVPQTMCIKVVGDRDKTPIDLFMYRCQFEECDDPLDCDSEPYEWDWNWNRQEVVELFSEDDPSHTSATCFRISEYHSQMDSWNPQGQEFCDTIPEVTVTTINPLLDVQDLGCGTYSAALDFDGMEDDDTYEMFPEIFSSGIVVEFLDCNTGQSLGGTNGTIQLPGPNSNVCIRVTYSFEDGAWWNSDDGSTHGSGQVQTTECNTTWGPFDWGAGQQPPAPAYTGDDTFCSTDLEDHVFEITNPEIGSSYEWNQNPAIPGVVVNDISVAGDGSRVELSLPTGWSPSDCTNVVVVSCGNSDPTPICFTLIESPTVVIDPVQDVCISTAPDGGAITTTNVSATVTPAGGNYCFNWNSGANSVLTTTNMTTYNFASAGIQMVTVSVEDKINGCISEVSAPVTFEVIDILPAPQITCGNQGTEELEITWTPVPGAIGYTVFVDGSPVVPDLGIGDISYTETGLTLGQTVTFEVMALGSGPCFDSALSTPAPCTTTGCPPASITQDIQGMTFCENENIGVIDIAAGFPFTEPTGMLIYNSTPPGLVVNGMLDTDALTAGVYDLEVTFTFDPLCPERVFFLQYIVSEVPDASFTIESPICQADAAAIDVSNLTGSPTWDYDGGMVNFDGEIEWSAPGVYDISVETNLAGCIQMSSQAVEVQAALDDIVFDPCDTGIDFIEFRWNDIPGSNNFVLVIENLTSGMTNLEPFWTDTTYLVSNLNENDNVLIAVTAISDLPGCESSETFECTTTGCAQPMFNHPYLEVCWDPADGPVPVSIGEVTDDNGNILQGVVEWLDTSVDATGMFSPANTTESMEYSLRFEWADVDFPDCVNTGAIPVQINVKPSPDIDQMVDDICVDDAAIIMGVSSQDPQVELSWDYDGGEVALDNWPDRLELTYDTPGIKTVVVTETSATGPPACATNASVTFEVFSMDVLNVYCVSSTETSITFGWDAFPGAFGYEYQSVFGVALTTDTEVTFDNLPNSDPITITVFALFTQVRPCSIQGEETCTPDDCSNNVHPDLDALLAFYDSTNGTLWDIQTGWADGANLSSCDPCNDNWYGVICNANDRVICLDLDGDPDCGFVGSTGNGLTGEIPSSIKDLTELQSLILDFNELTGNIPAEIIQLDLLERFTINSNQMDGLIPVGMGNMPELRIFIPGNNNFSGCYPEDLRNKCGVGNFDFTNNPLLPWQGDFSRFCNGDEQLYALCNDGAVASDPNVIDENCECGPCPLIESFLDTTICLGTALVLNGQTYDQDGQHDQILQTSFGCDSLVNITLSVTEAFSTTFQEELCPDESVEVNGTSYDISNPSGEETLTSTQGCDSIISIQLSFYNELEAIQDNFSLQQDSSGIINVLDNDILPDRNSITIDVLESENLDYELLSDGNIVVSLEGGIQLASLTYVICDDRCFLGCESAQVFFTQEIPVTYDDEVLSPNDDGINDVLVIEGFVEDEEIENSTIFIFNRWGQLVFETTEYRNNWKGTLDGDPGKPLPEGIYYYYLYVGLQESYVGSRSIIR